jgi:uncharacterized repeat protein (TIGR02543 family)
LARIIFSGLFQAFCFSSFFNAIFTESFKEERAMYVERVKFLSILLLLSFFVLIKGSVAFCLESNLLSDLSTNNKIIAAQDLLDIFSRGGETVDVIVMLKSPDKIVTSGSAVMSLDNDNIKQNVRTEIAASIKNFTTKLDRSNIDIKRYFSYMSGFSAKVSLEGLSQLAQYPEVVSIEKNAILHEHLAQGIPLMNATAARNSHGGRGIAIAICDTGIDTSHSKLGNGGSPVFNSKVIGGYDTGDDDADPRPSSSGSAHGTACAGIAAGDIGSTGDYIGGVAPEAKLYAIKISTGDTGSATLDAMIAGWEWCVTHQNDDSENPILIISTSFGGGRFNSVSACDSASPAMTTAANNAVAAGITIFASSGNDGYCDSMGWPACISHVISVGAVYYSSFGSHYPCINSESCASKNYTTYGCSTHYYAVDSTASDMVPSYSNTASFLDVLAPSNAAYTTDIAGSGGYDSGDYYSTFGGTSAACPYAAGAAAVLQHTAKAFTGSYLTPAQVKQYLVNYGDNVTDDKVAITKPRINLGAAVSVLTANPTYNVTYDGNGNTAGNVPVDANDYENGDTVTVLDNTGNLVRTGYTFTGWNTADTGNGTAYAPGDTFNMGSSDVTLYAMWKKNMLWLYMPAILKAVGP